MGGDDRKRGGTTKRFTREELAELANKARGDDAEVEPAATSPAPGTPTPMSRSQTLHDPLTTQLLAEVARRVQAEIDERAAEDDQGETAHPHTRRRRST
jgi:cell pole-organizing protein PopZ